MDLLDDIFSEPSAVKAPVRSKFHPKAKLRPKKGPSSAGPTPAATTTKEQAIPSVLTNSDSSQLVQTNDSVNNKLDLPNSSATETAGTEETLLQREIILRDRKSSAKAVDESAGTSLGSQGTKDFIGQSKPADMQTLDASTILTEEDTSGFPNVTFASASPFRPCSADGLSIPSRNQESFAGSAGDFQIDVEQETVDFSFLEDVDIRSDAAVPSGNRAVKFQPKPKIQSTRKTDTAEIVSHLPDAAKFPSEDLHINGDGLIHSGGTVIVQLHNVVPAEVDSMVAPNFPNERGNDGKRVTSDAVSFSHDSLDGEAVSLGVEATEDGYQYLDGVNDEIQFNSSSPAKGINEPAATSDENNDDYHLEEEILKNRLRNSKIVSSEYDQPSRKRMKEVKAPEESTKKARKKFPRATRRKRSVDKSFLEAPEDEIDLQKVRIRDLIILAEHKERQLKKQAAEVQQPSTNDRSESTLQGDPLYDEDEAYGSDRDTGSFDNPSTSRVIEDTGYFNYQSFTGRKQTRWSKHETKLFYQGIQEFGSDFTMIQQRYFPDRSRHQIKLKYKKEEREHPMRIHDALTSRAKDLSHFEALIQKLQEQAAQEKAEQSGDENLIGSTAEENEGRDRKTHETHEAAKPEQNGRSAAPDQEPDYAARVQSPVKSYDSEDEFDWNEYKSEL